MGHPLPSCRTYSRSVFSITGVRIDARGQPRAAPTRLVFLARGRARLVGCSALFGSPPLPRTALVVLRTPRSASLTASAEGKAAATSGSSRTRRSEEHTSELQSRLHLVCRLLLEKKKKSNNTHAC